MKGPEGRFDIRNQAGCASFEPLISSFDSMTTAYAILDAAFRENLPSWRGSEHQIHG